MELKIFFERFFPVKYNFYSMLNDQAELTAKAVSILVRWLKSQSKEDKEALLKCEAECDEVRRNLESKIVEAFTTPFDRQEIYAVSVEMDKILDFTRSTLEAMEAFDVKTDDTITKMLEMLEEGTAVFSEAVKMLEKDTLRVQNKIVKIRGIQAAVELYYREGMVLVFKGTDAMQAIKHREVYHHIKDASVYLGYTVDIFHRIVVRLV
jgi:uncharacterized protein Yka (UPF0111/DUF47 family)